MKKILVSGFALVTLLSACGDDMETISSDSVKEEVVEKNIEQTTEAKESNIGSRSNPVPVGQKHTVKQVIFDDNSDSFDATVDITISEVERGESVYKKAYEMNEYNEEPQEGYEYVSFKVDANVKEAETQDFALFIDSTDFDFISKEGSPYEMVSVVYEPELSAEVYAGGSTSGYVVGQVKIGEEVLVVYEDGEWKNVFFSIE